MTMTEQEYELTARFDSRKSFYGKARVRVAGNKQTLISYSTPVATIDNGQVTVFDTYSATTLRHIKEFLAQAGYGKHTKASIEQNYIR